MINVYIQTRYMGIVTLKIIIILLAPSAYISISISSSRALPPFPLASSSHDFPQTL